MSYTGSISIVDDEGNLRFERELSTEEIVKVLLDALGVHERSPEPSTSPPPPVQRGEPKPCCGSKGVRHKRDCGRIVDDAPPVTFEKGSPKKCGTCLKPGHNSRSCPRDLPPPPPMEHEEMLTEDQWEQIKDLRDNDDRSSLFIANELGLPLQQVNHAILAPTFAAYRSHYEYQAK